MRKLVLALAALALAIPLASCEPYRSDSPEYTTVSTLYRPEANFSSYTTFAMPDSIAEIGDADVNISHDDDEAMS